MGLPMGLSVDPVALPYAKDGLSALLREAELKLESPKTISAEKERPPVPTPVKAFPPVFPVPEFMSWV